MIGRIAVGKTEGDAPAPRQALGPVIGQGRRVEIEHVKILRDAALGRQVHPDVVDEHAEKVIIGIDATDHAARYLLHTVREKHVVARLYQRVDLLRIELRPVSTAFGPCHAAHGLLVDGRMLDDLHRGLLDRNHSRLGHAVDGGSAQRELRDGLRGLRHSTRDPENKGAKAQNPDYRNPGRIIVAAASRRDGKDGKGAPHPVRRYIPELMVNRAVKWCPNTPRGYTMGW